ncbi:MAG: iron ABC transporter permease [Gammaproteobacteria bacterium]|nr:iron ABC transporter permease [Gammaproteobacteria bacterium]
MWGAVNLGADSTLRALLALERDTQAAMILYDIRIPRALMAAFVGALLAICGAVTQGLFRNPLADPSLIGVTAGATTGAALMIFFAGGVVSLQGLPGLSAVSLGAFLGGAITVMLVYRLATSATGTSVTTMLLAGVAITALAGGLSGMLEYFSDNQMLRRISLWRMGGLDGASSLTVTVAAVATLLVVAILPRYANALNALLLGESEARHLGIAVQTVKLQLILIVALGVGLSVALAGSIAFVGLVVPHIVRLMVGPDHRTLLPASAMGGAILLLLADLVARTSVAPVELPVGIVTALLGAPFFISLLRYRHSYGMQ